MVEFLDLVEQALGKRPLVSHAMTGGSIGQVYQLTMPDGERLVAKTVAHSGAPLTIEGDMLTYLREQSELPVPAVIFQAEDLLILEFVDGESQFTLEAELDAAGHLARLHNVVAPRFGFERDTLIGAFSQPNPWHDSWIKFFSEQRLLYMGKMCHEIERLPASYLHRLEQFCARLDRWLIEPPAGSLLHGDVWTTNLLADRHKIIAFLDPALYYGNPEVELAYIALFGTFGEAFFRQYQTLRPWAPGFFEARLDIYKLYPLLVHVRHFGGSYLNSVDRSLARFGF